MTPPRLALARLALVVFAFVVLALAAPALCTEPPELVATWKGGELTRADHASWLAVHELEASPEAIQEQIFVASFAAISRERGVENEPRTRLELQQMRGRVLTAALREHVAAGVEVSDAEVEQLRREHPEAFQRKRKLLLRNVYRRLGADPAATREHLEALLAELRGGADFKAVARSESESQTRFRDGHLGFVDPDELPAPVADAVRGLQPGQLSGVVEHGEGMSIFLCEEIREGSAPSAEEARAKVRAQLERLRGRERWASYEQTLSSQAAPRLDLAKALAGPADATVLEVEGYKLSAGELTELVALASPGKTPAELGAERLEALLRGWALGVVNERRARELGLDRDPQTAATLRFRELEVLARRELVRRIDARLREPSEEQLRQRFEANPRRYLEPAGAELAVIQLAAGSDDTTQEQVRQALDVAGRLERGELGFEAAARRYSLHPSAAQGGSLGWQSRRQIGSWGPTIKNALDGLRPGERTGLLRDESGLWIFELRARREAKPASFESVRERIRGELRALEIRDLESAVRREQIEQLGIVIRSGAGAAHGG